MKYMAAVLLLVAAMSAQNAPTTNKGRHLNIPAISREANGAVVSIVMADNKGQPIAQGSGFVVTKNGLIVTNYHVIKNGTSAVIKLLDGSFFTVDGVLAFDKNSDVAVIKAHGINFKAVALGDSDRLQIGEEVVAIGSPLSLESTVSNGIVSGIRTEALQASGSLLDQVTAPERERKLVQITAPISHGSSGGPLFNMAGEVVGITSSALIGGENLNFAVPINDVKPMLAARLSKASAFPDEPEEATKSATSTEGAPSDNSAPSLAETEKWMADAINEIQNETTYRSVDGLAILTPDHIEAALCTYGEWGCWYLWAWDYDGLVVNVHDGHPHEWVDVQLGYVLEFNRCEMTLSKVTRTYKYTGLDGGLKAKWTEIETDHGTWILDNQEAFKLGNYDPQVTATKDATTEDIQAETTLGNGYHLATKIPKGTKFIGDSATVTAVARIGHNAIPIRIVMRTDYAPRFAKALSRAIGLCGGVEPF
jgi:S1-C subfamily serine protease